MINIFNESHTPVVTETIDPSAKAVETVVSHTGRLEIPKAAQPIKLDKRYVFALGLVHCLALLAVIPWFYSLTGLLVGIAGIFVFAMMGINIGLYTITDFF